MFLLIDIHNQHCIPSCFFIYLFEAHRVQCERCLHLSPRKKSPEVRKKNNLSAKLPPSSSSSGGPRGVAEKAITRRRRRADARQWGVGRRGPLAMLQSLMPSICLNGFLNPGPPFHSSPSQTVFRLSSPAVINPFISKKIRSMLSGTRAAMPRERCRGKNMWLGRPAFPLLWLHWERNH